jgi:hypothetical protein
MEPQTAQGPRFAPKHKRKPNDQRPTPEELDAKRRGLQGSRPGDADETADVGTSRG